MIIREKSYARAGLVGNPSDGYHGKTISFIVKNFAATVELWESPELHVLPNASDHSDFESIAHLARDVRQHGYYGGIRLLKASIKLFFDYCLKNCWALEAKNFTIRYHSNIPPQVGMAGSSAIITACWRALMRFYEVSIPNPVLANLVLAVEQDELRIPAGLQDRVIQVYEGMVFMDFDKAVMEQQGFGNYEPMDPTLLPPVFVAYSKRLSEGTEVLHNNLRARFHAGDNQVLAAIREWAELAQNVRDLILAGRGREIGPLLNRNFDLRRSVCSISKGNLKMVEAARSVGASAKFTGSGGAIVGTYEDEPMFERLKSALVPLGVEVFKPVIV